MAEPLPWALRLTLPAVPVPPAVRAAFSVSAPVKVKPVPPALKEMELADVPLVLVADMVPLPAAINAPPLLMLIEVEAAVADVVMRELLVKLSVPDVLFAIEMLPLAALVLMVPLLLKLEPFVPEKLRLPVVDAVLVIEPLLLKVRPPVALTDMLPVLAEDVMEALLEMMSAPVLATEIEPFVPEVVIVPELLNVPPLTLNVIG